MKRVFTQNKNISFIDYNHSLKSNTMLNNSLTHGRNYKGQNLSIRNNEYIQFVNYSTFLDISKGYFRRFVDAPECAAPFTVDEGKKSSVYYESKAEPNVVCMKDLENPCLYPYGKYKTENVSFQFLTPLIIPEDKCDKICHPSPLEYCQ